MRDLDAISANYTLRPSELAGTLGLLVEAQQPAIVRGPLGCAVPTGRCPPCPNFPRCFPAYSGFPASRLISEPQRLGLS